MVTTRPNTTSSSLARTGAGLLAGAAASLGLFSPPPPASDQAGKAYGYGGNGPDSFDCSGLTAYAYRAAGIELPRRSADQATVGTPVARADLQPGDLVFYYEPISHIGIYVGDGVIVHAGTESTGVEYTTVDMAGYTTARRIA